MLYASIKSFIFLNSIRNRLLFNLKILKFVANLIFLFINSRIFLSKFLCFFIEFLNFQLFFKFLLLIFWFLHFKSLFFFIYFVKLGFCNTFLSDMPFIFSFRSQNSFFQILIFPSDFYFIHFKIRVLLCPFFQFKHDFITFLFQFSNFCFPLSFFLFFFNQILCYKLKLISRFI